MDGFERRRELKKAEILQASLDLFMVHGVQKVSISEIAAKANVSQVTIYNYFQSKQNLIDETIVYYVDKSWDEGVEILESNLPFPEKIKQLIFNKKEAADNIHEDFYFYFMKEYNSGLSYIEEVYQKDAIPRLINFFNEGKEEGYIDPNLSNEAILLYFQILKDSMQREDIYEKILPFTEDITKILFYGIAGNREK
ncbi:TetR/AcrR family transcriptional regulator [Salipaludibacillus daqingensis]|uniref:TetR/AcrR family transcriptional regulator n=1 Tax=Salipaludibacillus daqingensis TaxID=3041001 RepID=UPI0024768BA6|nr:TetR/AcrR family transcriptional regulator [Salipaludibacillus daqingensis]